MNKNASQAILEEVLRRAMDEALALHAKEPLSDEDHGALMAYFNLLDWGKQQAAIMEVNFGDRELNTFDPYTLFGKKAA